MNLNNFTIKAQEAIAKAQQLAFDSSNPAIDTDHLLKALLSEEDSPVEFLLKKNNVNVAFVESKLDESIQKLPKVSGGEPAQTISRELNNAVLRAGSDLKQFGDEFVSVEHLLLGLVQGNDNSAKLLKDAGLTEKGLIAAIKDLRKGSTVNSQTQETTYNALNKYAKNLNELAIIDALGKAPWVVSAIVLPCRHGRGELLLCQGGRGASKVNRPACDSFLICQHAGHGPQRHFWAPLRTPAQKAVGASAGRASDRHGQAWEANHRSAWRHPAGIARDQGVLR